MKVRVYTPDVQVRVWKTVVRPSTNADASVVGTSSVNSTDDLVKSATQDVANSAGLVVDLAGQKPVPSPGGFAPNQVLDLTPFLGDGCAVHISKSVRDMAGAFSLTLVDKPTLHHGLFDSIYGLVEAQDYVEIRVRHFKPGVGLTDDADPPVYMRGFVSEVVRTQEMGADGKPHRSVTISGQDMGKLLGLIQIMYTAGYLIGQDILSAFPLFEKYQVGFSTTLKATDFVQQVIEKIVNKFLKSMMPANSPNPTEIKLDMAAVPGVCSLNGAQTQEGTLYHLLTYFTDVGVWNEMFIESRNDGEYLVFRPAPTKDINGKLIQPGAVQPTTIDVQTEDLIGLRVARSDANTANYYWTRSPRFELVSDVYQRLFALQSAEIQDVQASDADGVNLTHYANSAQRYYGMRAMLTETQMGGDDITTMNSGLPTDEQAKRDTSIMGWITARRTAVAAANRDNAILETGTAKIRADERIRAGVYVNIWQGAFMSTFYVPKVDVEYVPYEGMFMTLTLERGTGYIARMNGGKGMNSVWLQEMNR